MHTHKASGPLYVRVASQIESQIRDGVLRAGEKLPSIRYLSEQRGVSISTALQAYLWLESGGWIEARTRSGFYVRRKEAAAVPEPDPAARPAETPADLG
ncbi:MAG: winged helix-turn-helix transcriptional regulator [Acidobacteria bacterium]|nr:winged helix-turn-helix transcriptional regulator [Acidobacteriota bacterium]